VQAVLGIADPLVGHHRLARLGHQALAVREDHGADRGCDQRAGGANAKT
jgi:hypothetical protein